MDSAWRTCTVPKPHPARTAVRRRSGRRPSQLVRRLAPASIALACLCATCGAQAQGQTPLEPFEPDEHTLVLYHFDEGAGEQASDSSGRGYHGQLQGPEWTEGKFGKALSFDGKDDSVYRETPDAIRDLAQFTVECWFCQDDPSVRQFLVGQDVGFHFDLTNGTATSLSIYNKGGSTPNAEGMPHQHLGTAIGSPRVGRWHHNAATYDGEHISFFLDGVLRGRLKAARDFAIGAPSRGLWVGCYVDMDFYYSGRIDEVRISDCIRYDPEKELAAGQEVFSMPHKGLPPVQVRRPVTTGRAELKLSLKKLYGGDGAGWVYLKPPNARAGLVGEYALKGLQDGEQVSLSLDVSDEVGADGCYVLGLVPTQGDAYFALTKAELSAAGQTVAQWAGEARSRRTFGPPVLASLVKGSPPTAQNPARMVLPCAQADRLWGELAIDDDDKTQPAVVYGSGYVEHWLNIPAEAAYGVHLRYAAPVPRPCDIVIDGKDLNAYNMCALNRTGRSTPADAFWEYQGSCHLTAGLHWVRIQDVPPDLLALRLDPEPDPAPVTVPWKRYPVPSGDLLGQAKDWEAETEFGRPEGASVDLRETPEGPALRFSTVFGNRDTDDLFAGDRARLVHQGAWDLEPFGRLQFTYQGRGSGHVIALWLVDIKGIRKLIWRQRDTETGPVEVAVPVSFEGNNVFDPGHVVAVCLELDEGNMRPEDLNDFSGALIAPRFIRRDELKPAEGYAEALNAARQALAAAGVPPSEAPRLARSFLPWVKPMAPEEHPLFATTDPKPVTRQTMGYELHFTGARSVSPATLDDFHKFYDFGDVCWPHIGILPLREKYQSDAEYQEALAGLQERLEDVRDRGLYVFDIWGYVPLNRSFPWKVSPEHHEILTQVMGDRFLGYDNGEHDGRYIGSYADHGAHTNRKEGWAQFVKWNEGICNDNMNYMNATGSLNFSHYYGELSHRTLGLETAQGLPSDTLMFAFLRGASKQYGRLMTQATSVWNRFGWNVYNDRKTTGGNGYGYGPNKGCSLSLHKRLMLCSYLGGHSIVGSETAQFTADREPDGAPQLSPLGRQHLRIREWVREHPDRGVMYTPMAFMLDFYNGWNMPRHLYRGDKYKVWGKLPYEKSDYLIDSVFRMVWPGYEDCSYLRDERGFITPTPFGDIFDVITNRCHPEVLRQYGAIMLMGEVELPSETAANLWAFVQAGGDLLLDARHAAGLPKALSGVTVGAENTGHASMDAVTGQIFDELPYTYSILEPQEARCLLVNEHGHPLVTSHDVGRGRVIVAAPDYWMTDELEYSDPGLINMEPPYRLLNGVQHVLAGYLESLSPVAVSPGGLTVRTCCFDGDPKRLLVGLINNDLFADWHGTLALREGDLQRARDIWAHSDLEVGESLSLRVPAGDAAIIDLRLD